MRLREVRIARRTTSENSRKAPGHRPTHRVPHRANSGARCRWGLSSRPFRKAPIAAGRNLAVLNAAMPRFQRTPRSRAAPRRPASADPRDGIAAAPLAQMRFCLLRVAETPIRHRQRIVNRGCPSISGERTLQILRGLSKVTSRQRRASCAKECRRRLRLDGERTLKRRLRQIQPVVVKIRLPQPDQRR